MHAAKRKHGEVEIPLLGEREKMIAKRLVLVAISIAVLVLGFAGCVTPQAASPKTEAMVRVAGEWGNSFYDCSNIPSRRLIDAQGNVTFYDKSYDESRRQSGLIRITKAWRDAEGRLWFRDEVYYADSDATVYELSRIDLRTMEWNIVWSGDRYPSGWDPVEYQTYSFSRLAQ